jgi:phospholipase/carboxylesterase
MKTLLRGSILCFLAVFSFSAVADINIPERTTPIPRTTNAVPHMQIGVRPVPEISDALLRRIADIPGVEFQDTVLSMAGAVAFWLEPNMSLARPDAIVRGREFAHMHPDGSLHASMPPEAAERAIEAGWAIKHPWSGKREGFDDFVMIYTPLSDQELDVVVDLVKESYSYITGNKLP